MPDLNSALHRRLENQNDDDEDDTTRRTCFDDAYRQLMSDLVESALDMRTGYNEASYAYLEENAASSCTCSPPPSLPP